MSYVSENPVMKSTGIRAGALLRLRRREVSKPIDGITAYAAAGAIEQVARVVAHIRGRWPRVRILLHADSGFAREDLMAWCEANGVDFLFGLAKNERLIAEITTELDMVAAKSRRTGRTERRFKNFMWTTRRTWSRPRRIVTKAEWTQGEANPRFVVASLRRDECKAKYLYE
jgi:hypothetical protein